MKRKNYILALLLILAGLQTAHAQVMKIWQNGKAVTYVVAAVDSLVFVENAYEWVDMGLPSGTLWATCNIGASSPEEFGYYFAWGETLTKQEYNLDNYQYYKDGGWTRYCPYGTGGQDFFDNLLIHKHVFLLLIEALKVFQHLILKHFQI